MIELEDHLKHIEAKREAIGKVGQVDNHNALLAYDAVLAAEATVLKFMIDNRPEKPTNEYEDNASETLKAADPKVKPVK